MGYLHIDNLYKNPDILIFKECFAMEKIHGTSAHIGWKVESINGVDVEKLIFFSGGEKYENFVKLFDQEALKAKFKGIGVPQITVFGEAYGGKQQGMSKTYGKELKFVAFDVKIDDNWLGVPQAETVVKQLGLEFVHYSIIPTTLDALNAERDADSVQAIRNGAGAGKMREGVVLRPFMELSKNNGQRIICKHKRDEFKETVTPREVGKLEVITEAQKIADEWVTEMRLTHVLDKFPDANMQHIPQIMEAMLEDVTREAKGEIEESKEARKAISTATVKMFKRRLQNRLTQM